jgi:hypothetical protein
MIGIQLREFRLGFALVFTGKGIVQVDPPL